MSNPSSFSSISFETETAIKFKKLAKERDTTHTKLLNELMVLVYFKRIWIMNKKHVRIPANELWILEKNEKIRLLAELKRRFKVLHLGL